MNELWVALRVMSRSAVHEHKFCPRTERLFHRMLALYASGTLLPFLEKAVFMECPSVQESIRRMLFCVINHHKVLYMTLL